MIIKIKLALCSK